MRKSGSAVIVQWAVDSAFRFFPLVRDASALPSLHPFDLATNKTLALFGRLEPRDWIDLMGCHDRIQPLGFLCWAACGKDPGMNPSLIVSEAGRSGRYTQVEVDGLSFEGRAPDAAEISVRWKTMLAEARSIVAALPTEEVGTCILNAEGKLFRGDRERLAGARQEEDCGSTGGLSADRFPGSSIAEHPSLLTSPPHSKVESVQPHAGSEFRAKI